MNDLQNAAAHIRGIKTVVECGFAHDRRDVVEFVYIHLLKGLEPETELAAFINDCKTRYGCLSPKQVVEAPQKPTEPPAVAWPRDGGALVTKPVTPPKRPSPQSGVPLNAMFAR